MENSILRTLKNSSFHENQAVHNRAAEGVKILVSMESKSF